MLPTPRPLTTRPQHYSYNLPRYQIWKIWKNNPILIFKTQVSQFWTQLISTRSKQRKWIAHTALRVCWRSRSAPLLQQSAWDFIAWEWHLRFVNPGSLLGMVAESIVFGELSILVLDFFLALPQMTGHNVRVSIALGPQTRSSNSVTISVRVESS